MKMQIKSLVILYFVLCLRTIPMLATPLELFVATNGVASNPGTKAQPFGTLEHARDHIRGLIAGGLREDVTVMVRGGTYAVTNPILFTREDTVSPTNHVTYLAYPGEEPIISGGKPITDWQTNASLWYAEVCEADWGAEAFREVFVNGERRPRAREPDDGFFRVLDAGPDRRTGFKYYAADLLPYTNLSGAEVVYFHDWSTSRVEIDSMDVVSNTIVLSDPIGASYSPLTEICHFEPHPRYYIENHVGLLDTPGEWYFDEGERLLAYWPIHGERIDNVTVVAPSATSLVMFAGSPNATGHVSNIHLEGITFAHCAWDIPQSGYAAYQAGTHEIRPLKVGLDIYRDRIPAALAIRGARNCSVSHCRFLHLGGGAISVRQGSRDILLSDNEVQDVGANGIMVGEMKGFPFSERDFSGDWNFWWYEHPEYLVFGTVISNNSVRECGVLFPGCVGIWVGVAEATEVTRNCVRDLPCSGVSVGWVWDSITTPCVSNIIERNTVSEVLQLLSDGGAIYTLGKQEGTIVRNNIVYDVHPRNGKSGNHGVFVDNGTTSLLFQSNVVYSVESNDCVRFNCASCSNTFVANTLVPMDGYAAFGSAPASILFVDNIVEDPDTWTAPSAADLQIGLCPVDADGNRLADAWEDAYLGGTGWDALLDYDGDGTSLLTEFVAGTHPLDNQSVLRIRRTSLGDAPGFCFATKTCVGIGYRSFVRHYTVEQSHSLTPSSWTGIPSLDWMLPTGSDVAFSCSSEEQQMFYRVLVTLDVE